MKGKLGKSSYEYAFHFDNCSCTLKHIVKHDSSAYGSNDFHFCNLSSTYPFTYPNIFCFTLVGALKLANPFLSFLVYVINYLLLTLYIPRAQIKLMSSFYSSTYLLICQD